MILSQPLLQVMQGRTHFSPVLFATHMAPARAHTMWSVLGCIDIHIHLPILRETVSFSEQVDHLSERVVWLLTALLPSSRLLHFSPTA